MSVHRAIRALRLVLVPAVLVLSASACVTTLNTFPPLGSTPKPAGEGSAAVVTQVVGALDARGLQAAESIRPYRPVEGPLVAAAPRTIVQVTLPEDPDHGFIVIYALPSPDAAQDAAEDQAGYVAAGIGGGILNPPGTEYALQVVGSSVVFFSWLPATSPDPRTKEIAEVLATLGVAVPIAG